MQGDVTHAIMQLARLACNAGVYCFSLETTKRGGKHEVGVYLDGKTWELACALTPSRTPTMALIEFSQMVEEGFPEQ